MVAARCVGIVVSLITSILVARKLGPEGKGILAFLSTASTLIVRLGSPGFEGSFTYFYVVRRVALGECIGTALWTSLGIAGLAAVLVEALLIVAPGVVSGVPPDVARIYFAALPTGSVMFLCMYIFFATGRELAFSLFDVGYRGAGLVGLVVALIVLEGGVEAAVFAQVAVNVTFATIALGAACRWARGRMPWRADLAREMLTYGGRYYFYSLSRFTLCYGGIPAAAVLLGAGDAGVFSVALMMGEIIILFSGSINLVFYPAVSSAERPGAYTRAVATRMLWLSGSVGLLLAAVATPLVPLLFGDAFRPAVPTFLAMLPGLVLLSAEQVVSSFFASRGMPWRVVAIVGSGIIASWILLWWLAPIFRVLGLGLAVSLAQSLVGLGVLREFFAERRAGNAIV